MPTYIIRFDRPEEDRYILWSTIVDAPTSYRMTRQQMLDWRAVAETPEEAEVRLARADRPGGCSSFIETREDVIACNRAGPDESTLTEAEIWTAFVMPHDAEDR